jgi:phytol kinase
MNVYLASALALGSLSALFAAARYARARRGLSAEQSRKFVHVGMGCICMSFPWLFGSPLPVAILAAIAATGLFGVRAVPWLRARLGCVLSGVERRSYGEFAFIAGIAAAFALAHGDALSYVIPVAVLTFADTVAALVGMRFGTHRFATPDGTKSLEGSFAFLATAFACVAAPLGIAGRPDALLVASIAALALTVAEAAAWAGLDNFAIPLLGGAIVRAFASGLGAVSF